MKESIKSAIARSISHNEIVRVTAPDQNAALEALEVVQNDEPIEELNHSFENDGDLDVWGARLGKEFRIRVSFSANKP